MTTIANYETQVADLLHDSTNVIWTPTQLDRYINEARRKLVMDTMCLRTLQTIYCTQGVEAYPFGQVTGATITAGGSAYASPAIGFTGGGGSGVAATLGVTSGAVTSISFSSFGSGYTSAPTANITDIGGSVTGVTITAAGTGYTAQQTVTFTPVSGGSGAAATVDLQAVSVTVNTAGAGYVVGDILTLLGGVCTSPVQIKVTTVNGSGGITAASIQTAGDYTTPILPSSSFIGGTGTGCMATVTWGLGPVHMTNGGSGYFIAPTVSFTGAGGATGNAVMEGGVGAGITVGAINANTFEILQVNLIWGAGRYSLLWKPWSEFSTMMRAWVNTQSRPLCWSFYGPGQIYLGPIPDQTYQIELDSVILPTDLSGSTVDPIPVVCQDPIKFYAAYLAKNYVQQFGEAEKFRSDYGVRLNEVLTAYNRRIPDPYSNVGAL